MTTSVPRLPDDVALWLTSVFASSNQRVAAVLSQVPTTHETALDMTLIQSFLDAASPRQFDSGWTAQISTHYLGGGRHWAEFDDWPRRWEIADIGILVVFRQGGWLIRSKVALLQSKRLYADELDWDEDSPLNYMTGFGRLQQPDDEWGRVVSPRSFTFTSESQYRALVTGVRQYTAIEQYEMQRNIPVYYLLYNPLALPTTTTFPLMNSGRPASTQCVVGCRVLPSRELRLAMTGKDEAASPAYGELVQGTGNEFGDVPSIAGWRFEDFVVELLIGCRTGYVASSANDQGLNYIFNRRGGPISAALAVTLDAP